MPGVLLRDLIALPFEVTCYGVGPKARPQVVAESLAPQNQSSSLQFAAMSPGKSYGW